MGYHSSDYDHDWAIGIAELARTTDLYNTAYSGTGLRSGCYKVDPTSIDGFAPDTYRDPSLPVGLSSYHSADFNRDGRIDAAELARVTYLYDTEVDSVRTGQYHVSPDSVDGFNQYIDSAELSAYQFGEDDVPTIFTTNEMGATNASTWYKLRCKILDGSENGFMATEAINNSGLPLEQLPPPGTYSVELYWIKYSNGGSTAVIGVRNKVTIRISPAEPSGDQTRCAKCPEIESATPVLSDQGQCSAPPVTRTCNAPDIPEPACNNEVYVTQYNPDATPRFSVVASLKAQDCEDILDESDRTILTVIQ